MGQILINRPCPQHLEIIRHPGIFNNNNHLHGNHLILYTQAQTVRGTF